MEDIPYWNYGPCRPHGGPSNDLLSDAQNDEYCIQLQQLFIGIRVTNKRQGLTAMQIQQQDRNRSEMRNHARREWRPLYTPQNLECSYDPVTGRQGMVWVNDDLELGPPIPIAGTHIEIPEKGVCNYATYGQH